MAREITPSIARFSFDQLVSEVDAIVEDLRWVHLELSLRNRCTEILFREGVGMQQVLEHAFADLREKLGVLALTVFLKGRTAFRAAFQDEDPDALWLRDRLPWMDAVDRWYGHRPRDASAQQLIVNHYTVDTQSITVITMPILAGREFAAVLLLVTPPSAIIPRLKRLVSGLSATLALAIATVAARQGAGEAARDGAGEAARDGAGEAARDGATGGGAADEAAPPAVQAQQPAEDPDDGRAEAPDTATDAATVAADSRSAAAEARLSKQYRFMIKYVPFPIFHLDERGDTIKNANPAFETLIGGMHWENMPLSDFGTLVVHGDAGDTRPCTLRLISPGGITITYRGMITPLRIFGKLIREVKLDPIG